MMANSLSEQTIQVSENILQEVKVVEIISDLYFLKLLLQWSSLISKSGLAEKNLLISELANRATQSI